MKLANDIFAMVRDGAVLKTNQWLDTLGVTGELRSNVRPLIVALVVQESLADIKRLGPMFQAWMADEARINAKNMSEMTPEMQRQVAEVAALHTQAMGRG